MPHQPDDPETPLDAPPPLPPVPAQAPGETDDKYLFRLFLAEVIRRFKEERADLKAADFEMVRKLMQDNSATLAMVTRGSFGDFVKEAAEAFPFPDVDHVYDQPQVMQ